jgi:hypothetical protein
VIFNFVLGSEGSEASINNDIYPSERISFDIIGVDEAFDIESEHGK